MRVPLLDLQAQYPEYREEVLAALDKVFTSQKFILGDEVTAFEKEIAEYLGAKHAIACASGSDALLLALMALEAQSGDAVVTTPFTFFATGGAAARIGVRPVFVDIDEKTFNLCPVALEKYLRTGTRAAADGSRVDAASGARLRALIPVHLYGLSCDMDAIGRLCTEYALPVIEDAAQAIGARWNGRAVGTIGDIGCFSFFPSKNLGAWGDGGLLTTQSDRQAERLRILRVHGSARRYVHDVVGINSRLDAIQAVVLRVKLKRLDAWTRRRQENAARYAQAFRARSLSRIVLPPQETRGNACIFHQFVVRVPQRDELRARLTEQGIGTEVYYPIPLHRQKCFASLGLAEGAFPVTEKAAREVLALPMYPEMTPAQIDQVADAVAAFYAVPQR